MNPIARQLLLELALADLVGYLREAVDRNRRGDGRPAVGFEEVATALARFDHLGGFEELTLDLGQDAFGAIAANRPAAGSGRVRTGSDTQPVADHRSTRLGSAGSGRDRTPSQAAGVVRS